MLRARNSLLPLPQRVTLCRLVGLEPFTALSILLTILKSRQSTDFAFWLAKYMDSFAAKWCQSRRVLHRFRAEYPPRGNNFHDPSQMAFERATSWLL